MKMTMIKMMIILHKMKETKYPKDNEEESHLIVLIHVWIDVHMYFHFNYFILIVINFLQILINVINFLLWVVYSIN